MLIKVSVVVDGIIVVTVIVRVSLVLIPIALAGSTGVCFGSFLFLVFFAVEMTIGVGLSSTLTITREVLVAVVVERNVMVLLAVEVFVSMTL